METLFMMTFRQFVPIKTFSEGPVCSKCSRMTSGGNRCRILIRTSRTGRLQFSLLGKVDFSLFLLLLDSIIHRNSVTLSLNTIIVGTEQGLLLVRFLSVVRENVVVLRSRKRKLTHNSAPVLSFFRSFLLSQLSSRLSCSQSFDSFTTWKGTTTFTRVTRAQTRSHDSVIPRSVSLFFSTFLFTQTFLVIHFSFPFPSQRGSKHSLPYFPVFLHSLTRSLFDYSCRSFFPPFLLFLFTLSSALSFIILELCVTQDFLHHPSSTFAFFSETFCVIIFYFQLFTASHTCDIFVGRARRWVFSLFLLSLSKTVWKQERSAESCSSHFFCRWEGRKNQKCSFIVR